MRTLRVDPTRPGITRTRCGKGFTYRGPDGQRVRDAPTLERIKGLVIPPAWNEVWICPNPRGHIQAIGTDAAGRKQYLYHPDFRTRRDSEKFDHMLEFAQALPELRTKTADHLAQDDLPRDRVLACAVRLLDRGFFRIGSEGYAEQNQTYGLATIRKQHVKLQASGAIVFDYRAKSGKRTIRSVVDPQVYEVVARLRSRRGGGEELLAFKASGRWVDVRSSDINAYIKEVTGGSFTAKDFRTWSATVLAAVALAVSSGARSESARTKAISRAVKEVAHYLGNTPAVARKSYIDPRVIDRFNSGVTIRDALMDLGDQDMEGSPAFQGAVERAVLDMLSSRSRAAVRDAA